MNVQQAKEITNRGLGHPDYEAAVMYLEGYSDALRGEEVFALLKGLEEITHVSQFDHPTSQIIGSEEYEGAWLDCVEIADKALKAFRAARGEKE